MIKKKFLLLVWHTLVARLPASYISGNTAFVRLDTVPVPAVHVHTSAVINPTGATNGNLLSVVYKGAKELRRRPGCKLSETYGSQPRARPPDDNAQNRQSRRHQRALWRLA